MWVQPRPHLSAIRWSAVRRSAGRHNNATPAATRAFVSCCWLCGVQIGAQIVPALCGPGGAVAAERSSATAMRSTPFHPLHLQSRRREHACPDGQRTSEQRVCEPARRHLFTHRSTIRPALCSADAVSVPGLELGCLHRLAVRNTRTPRRTSSGLSSRPPSCPCSSPSPSSPPPPPFFAAALSSAWSACAAIACWSPTSITVRPDSKPPTASTS